MERWSAAKAWEWYDSRAWIRGFNGYPSNCVNRVAFWQKYNHREVFDEIRREFALARETGFNAVRTIVQFDVWRAEHDSFMENLREYMALAHEYGLGVMLCTGNDCTVPKGRYKPPVFGEQHVDWGYHSGIKLGPHTGDYSEPGYMPSDEPELMPEYLRMIDELASEYARDERLQIWDVWNEIGNSNRGMKSVPLMEKCFELIRSHDPIQPLTADVWSMGPDGELREPERRACELSDVITFHYYGKYQNMVKLIENLRDMFDRPLINNEWLNRIEHNNVDEIFPLFYLERIGSYNWGLIQGYSQTYEPWGAYMDKIKDPNYSGDLDLTKLQHDLFRFNGLPYIAREIEIIKDFSARADARRDRKQ